MSVQGRRFIIGQFSYLRNRNDPKPLWTSYSFRNSSTIATVENTNAEPSSIPDAVVSEVNTPEQSEVLLYRRDLMNPDAMHTTTLMRSGFFFSTFHTLYWVWYTFDFLPAVNASPMTVLHVDPMIGVAGIGFAMALQSAFMIFPWRLVSKLTYRPDEQKICVHTHRLPLMYPSVIKPNASFPVGPPKVVLPSAAGADSTSHATSAPPKEDMESLRAKSKEIAAANARAAKKIRYFTLDPSSPAALSLIQGDSQGDISKHRGYIVVGPSWPRYVLDIKAASEVKEPALLLKILLHPETFQYKVRKEERRASLTPFQLRSKARQRKVAAPSRKHKRR